MKAMFLDIQRLPQSADGNVLPMAVVGIFVMVGLVGGAVDMSRAYKVQNRLQNACDSGVLAGRRSVTTNGFDTVAKTQAEKYFAINFDQNEQGTSGTTFLVASDTNGKSIGGKASTKMPYLIMPILGLSDTTVAVNCASTMGVGNSDVTMVLDVTGSMGTSLGSGTRLSALKTAMKNFYTTLATATQGTNARIRYQFVPFSTTVNVGKLIYDLNPNYIADTWTYQSRTLTSTPGTPDTTSAGAGNWQTYDSNRYNNFADCAAVLPPATAWSNSGSPSSNTYSNGSGTTTETNQLQTRTYYQCFWDGSRYRIYKRSESQYANTYLNTTTVYGPRSDLPVAQYKTFAPVTTQTGTNGANVTSTWEGCIEERKTVAASSVSFSTLTGMSPNDAYDLDIDSAPDGTSATQWGPYWPAISYYRNSVAPTTSGSKTNEICVPKAKALTEMTQSVFNSYADSLTAQGNTYLDVGMLWGARLSSPDGIFKDTVNIQPTNGGNVSQHVIFMTDGIMEGDNTAYQTYGIEYLDRRVTNDGSSTQEDNRHSMRFRAICDAIKAKGIRIWVIGFTSGLTSDLSYCASPNSSYTANDATQLNNAFQEIAKQVGELRVLS